MSAVTALTPRFAVRIVAAFLFAIASSTVSAAPVLTISGTPATSVVVGQTYAFQPTATSRSGAKTFTIAGKPVWAVFSSTTGLLSGTPQSTQVGTYPNIVIGVTDGRKSVRLRAFALTVSAAVVTPPPPPANTAPTIG